MRILLINSRYRAYGGEERTVEYEADLLDAAGHEVCLFEESNEGGLLSTAGALATSTWNIRQAKRLKELVRDWKPDVAHVHNLWFSLSPSILHALKKEGIPIVLTIHNYRAICVNAVLWRDGDRCFDCVGQSPLPGVLHGCYRDSRVVSGAVASLAMVHERMGTWNLADGIIVPSQRHKDILVKGGFREEALEVFPWTTWKLGERLNVPSGSRDVLFLGRLEPEKKGIEKLVERWNRVYPDGTRLCLNIVGTGPLLGSTQLEGPSVICHGWVEQEELDRMMLSSRALICPSLWEETFGLVVIEGFAAGLPVLGSDRGALPDTVGRLDPHCVLGAEDEAAWDAALGRLKEDEFVDELGSRAEALFQDRFSEAQGLERLEGLYGSIVR